MPSDKAYLEYILEQLSPLGVQYRPMMGEYLLYLDGKYFGGVCDDRLLVKPTPSAVLFAENAVYAAPYEGAKEMLLVENTDDQAFVQTLMQRVCADLPPAKAKRAKKGKKGV